MPAFRTGTVTAILSERAGLQRVEVDGEPSYVLTQLIGNVAVGDRVVVNTTAVDLSLGTGGWHVVHWNLSHQNGITVPGGGHVMKLRYTSLQADLGVAEEHHEWADTIDGTPVVALALHSQLGPAAAAMKSVDATRRIIYVMTDAGALPLALSDLAADLVAAGLVDATVTAGHAFGGDAEAVNVRSALAVACHHLRADLVIVGMGPGSVGTGTGTGFSGLSVGATLDAVNAAHGHAIAALRVSDADSRPRHQGVSDHSRTVLRTAVHTPVTVPVPHGTTDLPDLGPHATVIEVDVPDALALLAANHIAPTTMGRDALTDPRLFSFAAAAGAYAARLLRQ
ncbi:MAG: DUF3866 family protein [Actinobacteria bacterium]|nr:DUF3866 family protein [Actinomycetota bacterium]